MNVAYRRWFGRLLGSTAPALLFAMAPSVAQTPTYTIDFQALSAGGATLSNGCYRLDGTLGEPAPGYSSSPRYTVYAGFRAAAPNPADDIFFSGFEEC
jgi:hypothetical protein